MCNDRLRREREREREGKGKKWTDERKWTDEKRAREREKNSGEKNRWEKKDRTIFLDDDVRAVEHLVQRYERARSIIASITNSKGRFGPDWSRMRNEI